MDLKECPEILQEKVQEYLTMHNGSEILGINIVADMTPYVDKSIKETIYTVSTIYMNLCTSFSYKICSKSEWSNKRVNESDMTFGEILNIVNNCEYLKQSVVREKINSKIDYLQGMAEKYNELNNKCHNKYDWRENAINEQVEALENILNNVTGEWDECYEEDLREFERNK